MRKGRRSDAESDSERRVYRDDDWTERGGWRSDIDWTERRGQFGACWPVRRWQRSDSLTLEERVAWCSLY